MRIFHNALYKLVALLIACILWSAAQGIRSVEQSLDVPITLDNVAEDMVVVSQSVESVNVRISGSRAAVRAAQRDPVRYSISLEGVRPGEHTFPVRADRFVALRRGAHALAHSPSTVKLTIEPVITKRVVVVPDVVGTPAAGYRLAAVHVDPPRVKLAGARSQVRRMRKVLTERFDVSGLRQTLERDLLLSPPSDYVWRVDKEGKGTPVRVKFQIERVVPRGRTGSTGNDGNGAKNGVDG